MPRIGDSLRNGSLHCLNRLTSCLPKARLTFAYSSIGDFTTRMDEAELIEARKRRYEKDLWWIEYQCAKVADGSLEDVAYVVWANRNSSVRWPGDPDFPLPPAVDATVPGYGIVLPDGTSRRIPADHYWPYPPKVRHRLKVLRPGASAHEVDVAMTQAEQLENYAHEHCVERNIYETLRERFPRFSKVTLSQAVTDALAHMTQ